MELTRRDAVAALGAVGAAGAVGVARLVDEPPAATPNEDSRGEDLPSDAAVGDALVAAARVVYPDAVSGIEELVETFLSGRLDREEHAAGMRRAVADLDDRAMTWYDD